MVKRSLKQLLRSAGYELARTSRQKTTEPPQLFGDPVAALHLARGSVPVAIQCPIALSRDTQGFSLAANGWHPLVASIRNHEREQCWAFEGSILRRYFASFQPQNAMEAIPGFRAVDSCGLTALPPHLFFLTPWHPESAERLDRGVRKWSEGDANEHGIDAYDFDRHGVPYFGPASEEVGRMETRRLHALQESILTRGFERELGDCRTYLVRRGHEIRAVVFGRGRHRAVTMAALGHGVIPAQFQPPMAVDVRDVADWPQVRSGVWSQRDALRYVDHLFDFDALAWARKRKLA